MTPDPTPPSPADPQAVAPPAPPAPVAPPAPAPAPADPAPTPPSPADPPLDPAADPQTAALRREAARYRTQLRDVEADRDRLAAIVDQTQRQEIEREARAAGLSSTEDLWLTTTPEALRAEDGSLDTTALAAHLDQLRTDRPHWFPQPPVPRVPVGATPPPEPPRGFGDVLRGAVDARTGA